MQPEANTAGMSAREIHETLYDGADLVVTFTNGRPPETVKVRKLPRREFARYALQWQDEDGEAAVFLDRDEKFVAALDEESFDAVMQEGRRLNFLRFANWFRRQLQKRDLLTTDPAARAEMEAAMQDPKIQSLLRANTSS